MILFPGEFPGKSPITITFKSEPGKVKKFQSLNLRNSSGNSLLKLIDFLQFPMQILVCMIKIYLALAHDPKQFLSLNTSVVCKEGKRQTKKNKKEKEIKATRN